MSQQMSTESPLVIHTGSLLSSLDQETQARVLELHYMKSPLVEAKTPFARMIQLELETNHYFDVKHGCFIRIRTIIGSSKLGNIGWNDPYGYRIMSIKRYKFRRSHLVYLWFTGCLPEVKKEIDHIDGNTSNDNPGNLRLVSHMLNSRNMKKNKNNTSGYTGVSYDKTRNKYVAQVAVSFNRIRRCFTLGYTDSPEEAFKIRELWLKDHPEYGFSPRHGT